MIKNTVHKKDAGGTAMKRRLTTMTLMLGLIFFSLNVYVAPVGNAGGGSAAISLLLTAADPDIHLEANPASIPADNSSYSIITAAFEDGNGNPVPEGTSVNFITNLGTFPPNGQDYTLKTFDDTGIVTVFLHAGITAGTATVTATLESTSESVPVTFYDSGAAALTVKAVPSTLTADGLSTSTITATVTDGGGGFVPDGTEVGFSADHGNFGGLGTATATTVSGIATVTYTAPSAKPAGGLDTVTATSDGASGEVDITLTGPTLGTIVLSANPTAIPANGTSTSAITATVTVEGGASAPAGVGVTFTIKSGGGGFTGGVTEIEKETNDSGIAVVTLISGTTAGTATIGASADGVTAQDIEVTYEPGSLTLTIVPNSVLATGEEEVQVTVLLKDADGNPVANETIDLTLSDATLGSFDDDTPTTDANGEATAVFTAGSKGGTVTVTATWDSGGTPVTGTGTITIQPPPAFIQIAAGFPSPQTINIKGTGGLSTSEIKFLVRDSQGNLVDSGYRIDFSIITGPNGGENLIPASTKTSNGEVATLLYSGFKSGPVSIRATYHHDTSVNTTTSQIVIVGGPAVGEEFGISANYLNVSGLSLAGLHDTVTANVADRYGNAVANNTAISFKTYNTGGFFEAGQGLTTGGVASDDLVSNGTYLAPLNGFVSITAEVVGGNTTRVSSIAVTPDPDTNIIYAGTNGGGVYKSMDSGATWQNISRSTENPKQGQNWIDPHVKGNSAICVDPDDHNTVYVGTGYLGRGHVYKSLDGGMNWNANDIEQWGGIFSANAAVLTVLCDGDDTATDYPYVWIGTEGQGAWWSNDDGETFTRSSSGLGYGKTVTEIVRVPDSHGNTAILYAATPTGVFVSTDGGQNWAETAEKFTNDIINTLILHPTSTAGGDHLLYVGTENAGVWFSKDGGAADPWANYYPNGMGEGLSATVPVPNVNNEGNGTMSTVTVGSDTQSEFWTVTYDAVSGEFQVEGSVSDSQPNATVDEPYITDVLSFEIYGGSVSFEEGDAFTFTTTRDPARTIKDLLIDPKNNYLYALTYFFGPLEPYHAVGNIYAIELDPVNDYEPTGSWTEANTGLPEYAPPRDTTLFPQHALATDNPSDASEDPTWFLVGGEGISMYKAKTGFGTGAPDWKVSKSGLSNRLMSRMPVLFSDDCIMAVTEEKAPNTTRHDGETYAGSGVFTSASAQFLTEVNAGDVLAILTGADVGVYTVSSVIDDQNVILYLFSAAGTATNLSYSIVNTMYNYTVYIQDLNGNPPISGSLFRVETYGIAGSLISTVFNKTYADVVVDEGTFRDPNDPDTDIPYEFSINFTDIVAEAKFTFTPTCQESAPGCSGSTQEESFMH